jgi:hypothetical protein
MYIDTVQQHRWYIILKNRTMSHRSTAQKMLCGCEDKITIIKDYG